MDNMFVYLKIKDAVKQVFGLVKQGMDVNEAVIKATDGFNKELTQRVIEEVNVNSYLDLLDSNENKAKPFPLADPKIIFSKQASDTLQKTAAGPLQKIKNNYQWFAEKGKKLKPLGEGLGATALTFAKAGPELMSKSLSGVADMLQGRIFNSLMDPEESKIKDVKKGLRKHKLKLKHQKILYYMMTKDDILKDVDPKKLISVYKHLVEIAPHVAAHKETAISLMRQLATQTDMVIDPMLLKIILEAETYLLPLEERVKARLGKI